MKYLKSKQYDTKEINGRIMGPNPVKLTEELLEGHHIPANATVLDLGCGQGVTSLFLAKEYGFRVIAADLWIPPTENQRFFQKMGLSPEKILALHTDADALPFPEELFDGVVTVDSYHYFGTDPHFLDEKLLPFVKHGGYLYIAIPGMHKDCHDNIPQELLLSWTAEDLDTIHDIPYWRRILEQAQGAEIISMEETQGNEELWQDWLKCDNEYARNDRKTMEAGGGKYLNFIAIVLKRK